MVSKSWIKSVSMAVVFVLLVQLVPHWSGHAEAATDRWTTRDSNVTADLNDVAYGNNMHVVVGNSGTILTSSDNGTTWNDRSQGSGDFYAVLYTGNKWVVAGQSGELYTSADGDNWTERTTGSTSNIRGLTMNDDTENPLIVAVGDNGLIITSPDGIAWTSRSVPGGPSLNSVTYGYGSFVAVGEDGAVFNSDFGTTWTDRSPGGNDLRRVLYYSGFIRVMVAVGDRMTVYSTDGGDNWSIGVPGVEMFSNLVGLTRAMNKFTAVGPNGLLLSSTDGLHWIKDYSGTTGDLTAAAPGNMRIIVVGKAGLIRTEEFKKEDLSSLYTSGVESLLPAFDPEITDYTVILMHGGPTADVTPTLADPNAGLRVSTWGYPATNNNAYNVPLNPSGPTTVYVDVTSTDNIVKRYSITFVRYSELKSNSNLMNLTLSKGVMTPTFSTGNLDYTASVGYSVYDEDVTAMVEDPTAKLRINGIVTTSGSPVNVPLHIGENIIPVVVTAQNNSSKTYTVKINRAATLTPTVVTTAVYSITANSAIAGGLLTDIGGLDVTERGVVYNTSGNPTLDSDHKAVSAGISDEFTAQMTGLSPNTGYYVRAYAITNEGTIYGEDKSFSTTAGVPVLLTSAPESVSSESARLVGYVTSTSGASIMEQGLVYGTSTNPTIADRKLTVTPPGSLDKMNPIAANLTPGTTYYYRAYAISSQGIGYGEVKNFTTLTDSVSVTTTAASSVASTSAVVGGQIAVDAGAAAITERGIVYSTSSTPTTSSGAKVANPGGMVPGTSGNFDVTLTGLTPGTTYYARAYATNTAGTTYGNEVTFATLAGIGTPMPDPDPIPVPTPTPSPTPSTGGGTGSGEGSSVEEITVPVEMGDVKAGSVVALTPITRTREGGTVRDDVKLTTDRAEKAIQAALEAKKDNVRVMIPDEKDEVSQVLMNVPRVSLRQIEDSNMQFEIFTENVWIQIPQQSISGFSDDLYFRLVPLKAEQERKQVEERAAVDRLVQDAAQGQKIEVVARPMTIETNMQSRPVELVLPLRDVLLPQDAKAREEYLSDLIIYVEHSDGEKQLVHPKVVDYKSGLLGLKFGVNKFSTFTILNMEGWRDQHHIPYMKGFPDGSFRPDSDVTRAQMAAILARNLGYTEAPTAVSAYLDIKASHWAAGAIAFVKEKGLMVGDKQGTFRPDAPIARSEMAAVVARYKHLTPLPDTVSSFTDVGVGHWASSAIEAANRAGYIIGFGDGTFRAEQNLKRAESVIIVNRLFDRGPLNGVYSPSWADVPADHWAYSEIEEASQEHYYVKQPDEEILIDGEIQS